MTTRFFNPSGLPPAIGFSYGALSAGDRMLHIAGMIGQEEDLSIPADLVEQFSLACRGVAKVIDEAGGEPHHLVSLTMFTTDMATYRSRLKQLGQAYREVFGKHFPPMALIGASELFEPEAKIELIGVAIIPTKSD